MASFSAPTDLFSLDRKIALAARALDGWRGDLAVDPRFDDDDPIGQWKELASKTTIEAIAKSTLAPISMTPPMLLSSGEVAAEALSATLDPLATLRPAAASWCAHLLIARGLREATAARAAAARDDLDSDSYGRPTSLRAMLRALARPRQAGGVPEGRAAAAIEDLAPQLLDSIVDEESRRRESADGLGVLGKCCRDVDAGAVECAEALLTQTDDEAADLLAHGLRMIGREKKGATWIDVLAVRRAADVAEGWPNALTARWLAELSRGTELFAGLQLDVRVDAGRLGPRADHACLRLTPPTGAWTFARGLYAVGVALRIHGRDAKAPYASHTVPHDRRPFVVGEAFLALASTAVFHARARGVARIKAEASARRLETTRLLERRHLALRVCLGAALAENRRTFLERFEALAPRAIGAETPRALATLLGAPGPTGPADDAARLQAIDEGALLAKELVDRFDVDWWRNPKAAGWIRDRCVR